MITLFWIGYLVFIFAFPIIVLLAVGLVAAEMASCISNDRMWKILGTLKRKMYPTPKNR